MVGAGLSEGACTNHDRKRLFCLLGAAASQAISIDAFAEVHRLGRHHHPHRAGRVDRVETRRYEAGRADGCMPR